MKRNVICAILVLLMLSVMMGHTVGAEGGMEKDRYPNMTLTDEEKEAVEAVLIENEEEIKSGIQKSFDLNKHLLEHTEFFTEMKITYDIDETYVWYWDTYSDLRYWLQETQDINELKQKCEKTYQVIVRINGAPVGDLEVVRFKGKLVSARTSVSMPLGFNPYEDDISALRHERMLRTMREMIVDDEIQDVIYFINPTHFYPGDVLFVQTNKGNYIYYEDYVRGASGEHTFESYLITPEDYIATMNHMDEEADRMREEYYEKYGEYPFMVCVDAAPVIEASAKVTPINGGTANCNAAPSARPLTLVVEDIKTEIRNNRWLYVLVGGLVLVGGGATVCLLKNRKRMKGLD